MKYTIEIDSDTEEVKVKSPDKERLEESRFRVKEQKRLLRETIFSIIENDYENKRPLLRKEEVYVEPINNYIKPICQYIWENGNSNILNVDERKLSSFVYILYRYLLNDHLTIEELVFIQSLSKTDDNDIASDIRIRYEMCKNFVITRIIEKYNLQEDDIDKINDIVETIFDRYDKGKLNSEANRTNKDEVYSMIYNSYKDKSYEIKNTLCEILGIDNFEELKSKNEFVDAIRIMRYIEDNTDFGDYLNPFLERTGSRSLRVGRIIPWKEE